MKHFLLFYEVADHYMARRAFAKTDPYALNGIVRRWYVREWTTVAGETAANPVRPQN
jgi:uncharacterized protein